MTSYIMIINVQCKTFHVGVSKTIHKSLNVGWFCSSRLIITVYEALLFKGHKKATFSLQVPQVCPAIQYPHINSSLWNMCIGQLSALSYDACYWKLAFLFSRKCRHMDPDDCESWTWTPSPTHAKKKEHWECQACCFVPIMSCNAFRFLQWFHIAYKSAKRFVACKTYGKWLL